MPSVLSYTNAFPGLPITHHPNDVDIATASWIANVIANGGYVNVPQQENIDNLIRGLKINNLWTKLDRLWLFGAENEAQALTDIMGSNLATKVGTPTFTANQGYMGDGTSSTYIDSNFTSGTNFTQNAASTGSWSANSGAKGSSGGPFFLSSAASNITYVDVDEGGTAFFGINDNSGGAFNFNVSDSGGAGLYAVNRSGASASQAYINGLQVQTSTNASHSPSDILFTAAIPAGRQRQATMGFIGGNLSTTDHLNLYNLLSTYFGSIGMLTQIWVNNVVTQGGTVSSTQQGYVDTLIKGLVSDGLWKKLDHIWLFASENETQALTDLIGGRVSLATKTGTPTFTANRGYVGDPSGQINIPTFTVSKFVQDDAHWGVWVNPVAMFGVYDMSSSGGSNENILYPWYTDGHTYWCMNSNQNGAIAPQVTGLYAASRYDSGHRELFVNGSSFQAVADASTSAANIFRVVQSGSATLGEAAFFYGSQLSSTDHRNIYNRLRTYMTSVGVP